MANYRQKILTTEHTESWPPTLDDGGGQASGIMYKSLADIVGGADNIAEYYSYPPQYSSGKQPMIVFVDAPILLYIPWEYVDYTDVQVFSARAVVDLLPSVLSTYYIKQKKQPEKLVGKFPFDLTADMWSKYFNSESCIGSPIAGSYVTNYHKINPRYFEQSSGGPTGPCSGFDRQENVSLDVIQNCFFNWIVDKRLKGLFDLSQCTDPSSEGWAPTKNNIVNCLRVVVALDYTGMAETTIQEFIQDGGVSVLN